MAWKAACSLGFTAFLLSGCLRKHHTDEDFARALAQYNADVEEPGDRIVCRREAPMGSHIKERVCRYQWQLDEGQLEGRAALDQLNFNARSVSTSTPR